MFSPKRCVVAWIDILGTTEKIKRKSSTAIFDIWTYWHSVLKKIPDDVKYKIFSDNMLICEEINEESPLKTIEDIIYIVNFFETKMVNSNGDFIRGAITVGDIYIDENFVLGEALLKAYEIETKNAIYPRIVLDKSVIQYLPLDCPLFKQDFDGIYFYNFMESAGWLNKDGDKEKKFINWKNFKAKIIDNCLSNKGNYNVYQKMMWLVNYVKRCCKEKNSDWFTDEEIQFIESMIKPME